MKPHPNANPNTKAIANLNAGPRALPATPRNRRSGSLADHLGGSEAFARIALQAQRLRQLQTLLDASLPADLAPGAHIANLRRGKVVIHADSGGVAVKLRQLSARLTGQFLQISQEITGIEVRVQPRRRRPAARGRRARSLTASARASLATLAAGLTEGSPLRHALENLLRKT